MAVSFVRQLGAEAGVQLNPLIDGSEIPSADSSDQIFAVVMRAKRGRIDKPFLVNSSNVYRLLGAGETVRDNIMNEAWVQVVEALNNGAAGVVVQRLQGTNVANPGPLWAGYRRAAGAGETASWEADEEANPAASNTRFAVKHLECFNDGIKIAYHADAATDTVLYLRIYDDRDSLLFEFSGSVLTTAKDDYGNSAYLPDVVSRQTDLVEIFMVAATTVADLRLEDAGLGYDDEGNTNWSKSDVINAFTEETTYLTADYVAARTALHNTPLNYAYISAAGTRTVALLGELMTLAYDTNRQLRFDIPGNLTPDEAVTFIGQLNTDDSPTAHLLQAFWSPIMSDDPTGVNSRGYWGVASLNTAYACRRNAGINALGFAPKHFAVAGREWPIKRRNMDQRFNPTQRDLNVLANAKINPVVFESFTGGGRYVFRDILTCAPVNNSLRKLVPVADMSASVDAAVTRAGKDILQLPMQVALKRMRDWLTQYFEGAQASGWLVPSDSPEMGGAAWRFEVQPNAARPYDRMDVSYLLRYDGSVRQIFVTQTLSR